MLDTDRMRLWVALNESYGAESQHYSRGDMAFPEIAMASTSFSSIKPLVRSAYVVDQFGIAGSGSKLGCVYRTNARCA